ncbi:MAG: beta-galactosidase, partial [Acidobacteria bacterium]
MSNLTRRDLLKTSLAASAGAVAAAVLPTSAEGAISNDPWPDSANMHLSADPSSPRERLLLDFGWRFQFGHANDPAKDFGLGARRREAQFAKSGNFLPVTRLDFKDADWRELDL